MHRDVKPANFLIGRNKRKHIVYITDYGIAKKYRDRAELLHLERLSTLTNGEEVEVPDDDHSLLQVSQDIH